MTLEGAPQGSSNPREPLDCWEGGEEGRGL